MAPQRAPVAKLLLTHLEKSRNTQALIAHLQSNDKIGEQYSDQHSISSASDPQSLL